MEVVTTLNAEFLKSCGIISVGQDYVFTADRKENVVLVLDPDTLDLVEKIAVGDKPYMVAFSQDYRYGFVTNTDSNDVSVIDPENFKEITRLPIGRSPEGIAVTY